MPKNLKKKKLKKMIPNSLPKDKFILELPPLVAPLVAQTVFGHRKLGPSAAQVLPMIEKSTKNDTKEPPNCETNSQIHRRHIVFFDAIATATITELHNQGRRCARR